MFFGRTRDVFPPQAIAQRQVRRELERILRVNGVQRLHPVAPERKTARLVVILERERLSRSASQELCEIREAPLPERIAPKLIDVVIPSLQLNADLNRVFAVEITQVITDCSGGVTNPSRSEIESLSGSSKC